MLCGSQHYPDGDACARRKYHMLDGSDQAAFHAGCAPGASAVGCDVLYLLQEIDSQGETRIYCEDQMIMKIKTAPV